MKIRFLNSTFLFILLLVGHSAAQVESKDTGESTADGRARETAKIDGIFAEWNKKSSLGVALGVIRDGKLIYTHGYGMADLENGIPITSVTAFYIGSTSKQFAAMCIALLEEEGKITIEDDVRKYVPEFPKYEKPVTIRHLIHHISGIRDHLSLWDLAGNDFADSYPEAAALAMIGRQKALLYSPGEKYSYSNSNYFLLSMIVKRASGKSLREYAAEKIFDPLGMKNTFFHDDRSRLIPNRAVGHLPKDDGFGVFRSSFDLVGDGGLYTTVEDLFKWDQNFYQNKLGKGGQQLIDRVLTHGKVNDGRELIYTWGLQRQRYRGLRIVYHNGAFLGFRTELLRFPDQKFSVIILGNLSTIPAGRLATQVADVYLADILQPRPPQPNPAPSADPPKPDSVPASLSAALLDEYSGTYFSEELDARCVLQVENGQLLLRVGYRPAIRLNVNGKDAFSGSGRSIMFSRNLQNRITGFGLSSDPIKDVQFVRK